MTYPPIEPIPTPDDARKMVAALVSPSLDLDELRAKVNELVERVNLLSRHTAIPEG